MSKSNRVIVSLLTLVTMVMASCDTGTDPVGYVPPPTPNVGGIDGCPDDPGKTEPGECGCGVPDTDSDGDGTPDCNDDCPDDPEKIEPGDCGCGQAETPECGTADQVAKPTFDPGTGTFTDSVDVTITTPNPII